MSVSSAVWKPIDDSGWSGKPARSALAICCFTQHAQALPNFVMSHSARNSPKMFHSAREHASGLPPLVHIRILRALMTDIGPGCTAAGIILANAAQAAYVQARLSNAVLLRCTGLKLKLHSAAEAVSR